MSSGRSARVAAQRKVMDEATRRRRARKALESLEQDNFHDDPHADLVMSKKALNLFQDDSVQKSAQKSNKRKSRTTEYYKQRFRKNFAQLLEEDATQNDRTAPPPSCDRKEEDGGEDADKTTKKKKKKKVANYISAQAPASIKPQRHFCAVCGFQSGYTCIVCGIRYCSLPCQETHRDTRCLKYTS